MTRRLFVDTAVLALAIGDEHPDRAACRAVVAAAATGAAELHVSTEAVQELLFHRLRRTDRAVALSQARQARRLCVAHPFDEAVLDVALDLVERSALRGRDAVHAATALAAGFPTIVTPDRDFDAVPGLDRVAPEDALAVR